LKNLSPDLLEIAPLDASPLPISLALVKDHLAVDGTDLDALIETYIMVGIRWAETFMRRTIFARSHSWVGAAVRKSASGAAALCCCVAE
jgi:hypothetical protein